MPDITMCSDWTCPMRRGCYRYRAIPNPYWQSRFAGSPRRSNTECWYHVTIDAWESVLQPTEVVDSHNAHRILEAPEK